MTRSEKLNIRKKVGRQNMKGVVVVSLVCLVTLVMVSGTIFAQGERPCAGDVAKFCSDVKQGHGRIAKCLEKHETQLSSECKAEFAGVKEVIKKAFKACEDDIIKYCPWVQSGEGRILSCLKENKSHLSEECRENISKARRVK